MVLYLPMVLDILVAERSLISGLIFFTTSSSRTAATEFNPDDAVLYVKCKNV